MKVLLVNGSPHKKGCTFTALSEVAASLEKNDVETEIMHLGTKQIAGCSACMKCRKTGKCKIDDKVNEVHARVDEFDGFVFGSPVHYASASGQICSFLDRLFYTNGAVFRNKVGAAVVSCRRGGATAAFDRLNKYFTISGMPIASSQYWNMVHGNKPEEVLQDLEGMQIMRTLGTNMAWLIKSIQAGRDAGLEPPKLEEKVFTNFIR
ncbi:MAG: flavodoxin family protein [Coriobacteriia bacterium]|nr:flavodoxin family protein [Coriobacteriia bacterium]